MTQKIKISGPVGGAGIVISTVDPHTPQPPDHAKRAQFLLGAERLTAQLQQERGEDHVRPHHKARERLEALHNELAVLEELLAQKLPDHVGPAAAAAGKVLFATLGKACFESESQAAAWARKSLPLTEAWKAAERDATERARANRDHQRVRKTFWEAAEALAGGVTRHSSVGGCLDLGRAIDECLTAGKWK